MTRTEKALYLLMARLLTDKLAHIKGQLYLLKRIKKNA